MAPNKPKVIYSAIIKPMKTKTGGLSKSWLSLAALLIAGGFTILVSWPYILKHIDRSMLRLNPSSKMFNLWKNGAVPVKFSAYFFNWTNPEEILKKDVKPKFKEIGPYVFTEYRKKVDIKWNNNDTITFKQLRYWVFDEKESIGDLDDVVVTLNAISLSAAYKSRYFNFFLTKSLSTALAALKTKIYSVKSVGELLFKGYEDKLMDIGHSLPFLPAGTMPNMDKFGWMYTRNNSADFDGIINMATESYELGKTRNINYANRVPFYEGTCGDVKGYFGDIYGPNLARNDLDIFSTDICRSVPLEYIGKSSYKGIGANKYVIGQRLLDNGTLYPENTCFCGGEECPPSGLFNVSACRYGTPSFISLPHFLESDQILLESVDGLSPNRENHEFYMLLEPETGIPLEVKARLQINMLLQPLPKISLYANAPKIYIPIFWFEQMVRIPDQYACSLKIYMNFSTISLATGSSILLLGIFIMSLMLRYQYFRI